MKWFVVAALVSSRDMKSCYSVGCPLLHQPISRHVNKSINIGLLQGFARAPNWATCPLLSLSVVWTNQKAEIAIARSAHPFRTIANAWGESRTLSHARERRRAQSHDCVMSDCSVRVSAGWHFFFFAVQLTEAISRRSMRNLGCFNSPRLRVHDPAQDTGSAETSSCAAFNRNDSCFRDEAQLISCHTDTNILRQFCSWPLSPTKSVFCFIMNRTSIKTHTAIRRNKTDKRFCIATHTKGRQAGGGLKPNGTHSTPFVKQRSTIKTSDFTFRVWRYSFPSSGSWVPDKCLSAGTRQRGCVLGWLEIA